MRIKGGKVVGRLSRIPRSMGKFDKKIAVFAGITDIAAGNKYLEGYPGLFSVAFSGGPATDGVMNQGRLAMAVSPPYLAREQQLDLHQRLVEGDPVAPSELAETFLNRLIASLRETNSSRIPQDFLEDAAGTAIVSLIKNPRAFDACLSKGDEPLFAYLCMGAKRDLQNILKRESRHWRGRKDLESVEQSPQAGKYLGAEDDPAQRFARCAEEAEIADAPLSYRCGKVLARRSSACWT